MATPTLAEMQAAGMTPAQITQALAMIAAGLTMPAPTPMPATMTPAQGREMLLRAGQPGAAPIASNQILQQQANTVHRSGQSGFVSTDRVDRVNLETAIKQIHAYVVQLKNAATGALPQNVTRYMSEEQMIAELERNYFRTTALAPQGTAHRTTLGGVECTECVLPSGRVWKADTRSVDQNAISQAPNQFAY